MAAQKSQPVLEQTLSGRIIFPGIAFGYAHIDEPLPLSHPITVNQRAVQSEIDRLDRAIEQVHKHLENHIQEFHSLTEEESKQILSSHLLILEDEQFISALRRRIEENRFSAERALEEEFGAIANRLSLCRDSYLRARAEDLRDICQTLRKALLLGDAAFKQIRPLRNPPVFLSFNIRPTTVLRARRFEAVAFVTRSTAYTAHGAILLRSSGIPTLGGVDLAEKQLREGLPLLVDAVRGELYVEPTSKTKRAATRLSKRMSETVAHRAMPAATARMKDGTEIVLWGNVDHPSQTVLCFHHRLSGIGLFRTEFLVLDAGYVPDEEKQFEIYKSVVESMQGRPIVIRTFDIGGDKVIADLDHDREDNPALGVRGLRRHLLRYPEELCVQLRAILRAAVRGPVSILLPMITDKSDLKRALEFKNRVCAELEEEGLSFVRNIRVGAMIEVPSAALNIEEIISSVDFVSIGTNDLLQYLTATDRDNVDVINYQNVRSSGLKPLMAHVMETARRLGREHEVTVCGELASDPEGVRFLLGLGITSLSISPGAVPAVRETIESL